MSSRVLLLIPTTSYKSHDFLDAAESLDVAVVVGSDRRQALEHAAPGSTLTLDPTATPPDIGPILAEHARSPFHAVLGVDDETTVVAAAAATELGLPHNPVSSVRACRDKYRMRRSFQAAELESPWFFRVRADGSAEEFAGRARYPCVIKPLSLAASRGVIRADDEGEFVEAFARIGAILRGAEARRKGGDIEHLLVEQYLPGKEVALEGLLRGGHLHVLALFDKPDPLEGPTFEETIYVTPSRLGESLQALAADRVAAGCRALELREGPVHAELRLRDDQAWLLEVAPRTIGGLCSRVLRFGAGMSLEEIVLRNALGRELPSLVRESRAAGVMMIPVPRAGVLRSVGGLNAARARPHIVEITISVPMGARLVPLPEGDRYVGFIFARAREPEAVERALRDAHAQLELRIE